MLCVNTLQYVNVIITIKVKIRLFQKYKVFLVIAFVAGSVLEDILAVWGEV